MPKNEQQFHEVTKAATVSLFNVYGLIALKFAHQLMFRPKLIEVEFSTI